MRIYTRQNPEKVIALDLRGQGYDSIAEMIGGLINLETLTLSNNNLKALPKSITKLKSLNTTVLPIFSGSKPNL